MGARRDEPGILGRRAAAARLAALVLALWVWAGPAAAHRPGESYVYLFVGETALTGEFHIRVSDLAKALPLDADGDGRASDAEVRAQGDAIRAYLAPRLAIRAGGRRHPIEPGAIRFFAKQQVRQFVLAFDAPSLRPPPDAITVAYRFLYDGPDPGHRPMLLFAANARTGLTENENLVSLVFGPGVGPQPLRLDAPPAAEILGATARHGIAQVAADPFRWALALLLLAPLVAWRERGADGARWSGARPAGDAARAAALSMTLAAAGLTAALLARQTLDVEFGRRTESYLIAASLIVVAVDNFRPFAWAPRAAVALAAGLLQGAGRTDYPATVGLLRGLPEIAVPGFGIGVWLALLALAAAVLPLLLLARDHPFYRAAALRYGAAAGVAIAAVQFTLIAFF